MSSTSESSEEEYNVEKILQSKKKGSKVFYLVKWEGYSDDNNSWEPEANLSNCHKLLADFKKRNNSKSNTPKSNKRKSMNTNSSLSKNEAAVTPKRKKPKKPLSDDNNDDGFGEEKHSGNSTERSILVSPKKINLSLPTAKSPRKSNLAKKIKITDSSESDDSLLETSKKGNILKNIKIKAHKKDGSVTKKYDRETVLTMFPGKENGFTKHYTVSSIDGATLRDDDYYLLVKFEELEDPQFILSEIVNKKVPQKVIDFYEKRVTFSK